MFEFQQSGEYLLLDRVEDEDLNQMALLLVTFALRVRLALSSIDAIHDDDNFAEGDR